MTIFPSAASFLSHAGDITRTLLWVINIKPGLKHVQFNQFKQQQVEVQPEDSSLNSVFLLQTSGELLLSFGLIFIIDF